MLDPPGTVSYNGIEKTVAASEAHLDVALRAARESIVLLQNNATKSGAPLLPIAKASKLALIGPLVNASHQMQSDYTGSNQLVSSHTPFLAISRVAQQHGGAATSSIGCDVNSADTSMIAAAVTACRAADACVLFLGMDNSIEGEGNDRAEIALPGQQNRLASAVLAVGKPTAVVLLGGAALAIADIKTNAPAIVNAFYPGEMGGDAIADVLYGDYSPSAKLTFTMYDEGISKRSMEDMSLRGAPGSGNGGITYQHYTNAFGAPLWPFGHGSSFSTFSHHCSGSGARRTVMTADAASEERAEIYVCTVTNTGTVVSDATVLAWLSSNATDAPLTELFAFGRVTALVPGKTAPVNLTLPPRVLALVDTSGTSSVRPGEYELRVGGDALGGGCIDDKGVDVCARMSLALRGAEQVLFSMAEVERRYALGAHTGAVEV